MSAFVVDTNVAIVANGKSDHVPPDCVTFSIDALQRVIDGAIIVLDDRMRILGEYLKHLSRSGQPGPGDAFMRWVWLNQANPERCEQVAITPRANDDQDFEEFPSDPDLRGFDRSDRKFVAVALASAQSPPILNATDTDWWDYLEPPEHHGVAIEFICPELMARGSRVTGGSP